MSTSGCGQASSIRSSSTRRSTPLTPVARIVHRGSSGTTRGCEAPRFTTPIAQETNERARRVRRWVTRWWFDGLAAGTATSPAVDLATQHAVDEVVLAREEVVERHRLDTQRLGHDASHAQPLQPAFVGLRHSREREAPPRYGITYARSRAGLLAPSPLDAEVHVSRVDRAGRPARCPVAGPVHVGVRDDLVRRRRVDRTTDSGGHLS
jgi:hypothetical protein